MELKIDLQMEDTVMTLKSGYQFVPADEVPLQDLDKACDVEVTLAHPDGSIVTLQGSMDYGPTLNWTYEEAVSDLPLTDTVDDWQTLLADNRLVRLSHLKIIDANQQLPTSAEAWVPLRAISAVMTKWNV
jgi:hypothetical protein